MPGKFIGILAIIFFIAQVVPALWVARSLFECTEKSGCLHRVTYLFDSDQTDHLLDGHVSCIAQTLPKLSMNAGCIGQTFNNGPNAWQNLEARLGDGAWATLSTDVLASAQRGAEGDAWNASLFLSQVNIHRQIWACFNGSMSSSLADPDSACVAEWRRKYTMEEVELTIAGKTSLPTLDHAPDHVAFGIRALWSLTNLVQLLNSVVDRCKEHTGPFICMTREDIAHNKSIEYYSWQTVGFQDTTAAGAQWPTNHTVRSQGTFNIVRLFLDQGNGGDPFMIDQSIKPGLAYHPDNREARSFFIPEEYIWIHDLSRHESLSWSGPFGIHSNEPNFHFTGEVVRGFDALILCEGKHDPVPSYVPHDYNSMSSCDRQEHMYPSPASCPLYTMYQAPKTLMTGIFTCTSAKRKTAQEILSEGYAFGALILTGAVAVTSVLFGRCSQEVLDNEVLTRMIEAHERRLAQLEAGPEAGAGRVVPAAAQVGAQAGEA